MTDLTHTRWLIERFRDRVADIPELMSQMCDEIEYLRELGKKVDDLENQVEDLEGENDDLRREADGLQDELDELEEAK